MFEIIFYVDKVLVYVCIIVMILIYNYGFVIVLINGVSEFIMVNVCNVGVFLLEGNMFKNIYVYLYKLLIKGEIRSVYI